MNVLPGPRVGKQGAKKAPGMVQTKGWMGWRERPLACGDDRTKFPLFVCGRKPRPRGRLEAGLVVGETREPAARKKRVHMVGDDDEIREIGYAIRAKPRPCLRAAWIDPLPLIEGPRGAHEPDDAVPVLDTPWTAVTGPRGALEWALRCNGRGRPRLCSVS